MITDSYRYLATKRHTRYIFQSEGNSGNIIKIVQFSLQESGYYNLGFGDWKDGQIDDLVISNNQDAMKVIRTVAKITLEFLKKYPKSVIVIDPIDEKRKKLYNMIFQRHFKEIDTLFVVNGFIDDKKEVYTADKFFDSLEISLKFDL